MIEKWKKLSDKEKILYMIIMAGFLFCAALFIYIFYTQQQEKEKKALNFVTAKEVYNKLLAESITEFMKTDECKDANITKVEYELVDFKRVEYLDYTASVIVNCISTDQEKASSIASAIRDYIPGYNKDVEATTYNKITGREKISLTEHDESSNYYLSKLLTIKVNGKIVIEPKPYKKPKSSNEGSDRRTCGICGRSFAKGSSDSFYIITNGICKQCAKNVEAATEMLDEMKG